MKAASRIRLFVLGVLFIFPAGLMAPARTAAAQPELKLGKWKLEGTVDYYGNDGAGAYRRIGRAWDIGLFIQGSASTRDVNGRDSSASPTDMRLNTSAGDVDRFSIGLSPELRHWAGRSDRLRTFYGVRASVGYQWSDDTSKQYDLDDVDLIFETRRNTRASRTIGAGILLGAEWLVTEHFGVAAKVNPVNVGYTWSRSTSETERTSDQHGPRNMRSVDNGTEWSVSWDYAPSLVASINF